MSTDKDKYSEIFDYLSAPEYPTEPEATVVFGRKDPLVAYALGDLIIPDLVTIAVISGGIGKDSGDIQSLGYDSEAAYLNEALTDDAHQRGYMLPSVLLEKAATNGGENARNSLSMLADHEVTYGSLTAVAHATSSRRLAETLKYEAHKKSGAVPVVHRVPTGYNFNPENPVDRKEAAAELLRIADWPGKGWLGPQENVPEDLVDFVRDKSQSK